MPKRTNDFQRLVKLVYQSLQPKGAKVTESAEVQVNGLSGMREIDVLIETDVGPFKMKIAVEAKDHSRRLNVMAIEQIIGKYRGAGKILIDKVVIVAHRGFTPDAVRKARMEGVDVLTLKEVDKVDWKASAQSPVNNVVFPSVELVSLEPPPPFPLEEIIDRGIIVCYCNRCNGQEKGPLKKLLKNIAETRLCFDPECRAKISEQIKSSGHATMWFAISLRNSAIRIDGQEHRFTTIRAKTSTFGKEAIPPIPALSSGIIRMEMPPTIIKIETVPSFPPLAVLPANKIDVICKPHGHKKGCLRCYSRKLLARTINSAPDMQRQIKEQQDQKKGFFCGWLTLSDLQIDLRANGTTYSIEQLRFHFHAFSAQGALHFTQYDLIDEDSQESRHINCGEAIVGGKTVSLVMSGGVAPQGLLLDIKDSPPDTA